MGQESTGQQNTITDPAAAGDVGVESTNGQESAVDFTAELAALRADNDALKSERSKLNGEAAKRRTERNEARQAEQTALEDQQQFRQLSESQKTDLTDLRSQLSEMDGYKAKATQLDQIMDSKREIVAARAADLPEWFQKTIAGLDVLSQEAAINGYVADRGGKQEPKPTPPTNVTGVPAPDGSELKGLANADPAAFKRWKQSAGIGGSNRPTFSGSIGLPTG